jgi:hypothetical protein|tara:strand:+ start:1819 stop:2340 length:522 start_codon:yes stop_codon:yes gene_type:complete
MGAFMSEEWLNCIDAEGEGNLQSTDHDRLFITVNAMRSGPMNPAKLLIRSNFMELLIRCSVDKYLPSGKVKTELEAVQRFNEEYLKPRLSTENSRQDWRRAMSFTEQVDIVMRGFKPFFEHLYSKFSGAHALPGQKPAMQQDEFEKFCLSTGLINDGFAAREIPLVFNLSMFT